MSLGCDEHPEPAVGWDINATTLHVEGEPVGKATFKTCGWCHQTLDYRGVEWWVEVDEEIKESLLGESR
jgi:hypothetical protein